MPSHRKKNEGGVLRRMFVVALISCLAIVPLGTTAYADGSDSPTPYEVTKDGIQLPAGDTFSDNGHVNIKATGSTWKDLHFEGKCITRTDAECSGDRHAAAQYIGKSSIPWEAFGLKEPFCVTWTQLAQYKEHFGEGGQKPVCVGNDTPPEDDTDSKKVEFCHATGSESNPFVLLDTSVNAFYQAGHDTHQNGRDIVPPFSYKKKGQTISFPGLNWDTTGQAIFKNGCEVPKPDPKCVDAIDTKDIEAKYTTDDFNASVKYTGKELCVGVSKTVSLNSYGTDGPTWETSGTQVFVDHDQFTVDKDHTSGTLTVTAPKCFYQTDLYWGSTRYDGTDGALPHYPDSWVPHDLIGSRNGGKKCDTPPPATPKEPKAEASATVCVDEGKKTGLANVTVTNTADDTNKPATYGVTLNGVTKQVKVEDGKSGLVSFDGLAVGDYTILITGDDGTSTSTTVKVTKCDTPPVDVCLDLPGNQPVGTDCTPITTPPVVTPECPDGAKWSDNDNDGVVDKGECQSIGTPISIELPPKKSVTPVTPIPSAHPVLPDTGGAPLWVPMTAIGLLVLGGGAVASTRRKKSVA